MSPQSRSPSGYSAWRLIADELRGEIVGGSPPIGAKLPSESELAARFDVHRHTVRQAVAALAADRLVVSRRGSGTFVAEHTVLRHRIGLRTRLSESLGSRGGSASGRLLESAVEEAPPAEIAERLRLDDRPALRMETVRAVDGLPIARATTWLDDARLPGFAARYAAWGSFTTALRGFGIDDYVRVSTTVAARAATTAEAADLELPGGSTVLVVRALDALPDGTPLSVNVTRFSADRVELDMEHPPVAPAPEPAPGGAPSIRIAMPADADAVAALAARTFALACSPTTTAESIATHIREVLSPERFAEHLAHPARRVLLAETSGRAVGYTLLAAEPPADPDLLRALRLRPEVELSKVYVERGMHGRGVARPLMAETLRVARELAGDRGRDADAGIWLGVNEQNARAIRFYERSGFRVVGSRSFRLSDAVETDHVMERPLAGDASAG